MLETWLNGQINTKGIILPEVGIKNTLPFNPEVEILDKEFDKMLHEKSLPDDDTDMVDVEYWSFLSVIHPKRSEPKNMLEKTWIQTKEKGEAMLSFGEFAHFASQVKVISPALLKELGMERFRNELVEILEHNSDDVSFGACIKILFPDIDTNTTAFNAILEDVDIDNRQDYFEFAANQANARIIWPEKFDSSKITGKDWVKMREILENEKKDGIYVTYAELAYAMTVMSARELINTDEDFKLIMNSNFNYSPSALPELPERRKF